MATTKLKKTRRLELRMNDDEHRRLVALCDHYAMSAASVLRMVLKARHDEVIARKGVVWSTGRL